MPFWVVSVVGRGMGVLDEGFLADRTIGRAFGTVSRLSVVCRRLSSVCNVLCCGKTVRPGEKVKV